MRDKITQLAIERIQEQGVKGVSFRDLGAAVGIKAPSVLYYYGSKDGLLLAVVQKYAADFLGVLAARTVDLPAGLPQLNILVTLFEEVRRQQRHCLCGLMAAETALLTPEINDAIRIYFETLENWITQNLTVYQPESSARPQAQLILSALEGALLMDRLANNHNNLDTLRLWLSALEATNE